MLTLFRKGFVCMLLALCVLMPASAAHASAPKTVAIRITKRVTTRNLQLNTGKKARIMLYHNGKAVVPRKAVYKSAASKIASVSKRGVIAAKAPGKTVVNITYKKNKIKLRVTVVRPVKTVVLDRSSLKLTVGDMRQLQASVKPANATGKTITWSSSAPDIASVNTGTVRAKKSGTAVITATAQNGKSAQCKVVVKSAKPQDDSKPDNPVHEADDFVTVGGVKFDLKYFPKAANGTGEVILKLSTDDPIDWNDVTCVVNNGQASKWIDNSDYEIRLSRPENPNDCSLFFCYTPSWEKASAHVRAGHCKLSYVILTGEYASGLPTGKLVHKIGYQITVYGHFSDSSFPISVYYKGNLIRTCQVDCKLTTTFLEYKEYVEKSRQIAREAFATLPANAPIQEKMNAVKDVIDRRYVYSGADYDYLAARGEVNGIYGAADCKDGAFYGGIICMDLGLDCYYGAPHSETFKNYDILHGCGVPAGHSFLMYFDPEQNTWVKFEAQGHSVYDENGNLVNP